MSNAALIAIVGPTAAGKSAVAMDVAHRLGAEIVNADAFCLYRGMDIGTAKPSAADQAAVVHHLLDTHDVEDDVDVATYQVMARAAIEEIIGRGTTALLVGGSGLYVQAVLDDLRFPGTDPRIRAELEDELAALGPQVLHERLSRTDPQAAAVILPTNGRRIVRALEVNAMGQRFQATLDEPKPWRPALRIGWDPGSNRWTPPSRHGSTLCGRRGSSRRSVPWRRAWAGLLAGPSGTGRSWRILMLPWNRRSSPHGAWRGGNGGGSAAMPVSSGRNPRRG